MQSHCCSLQNILGPNLIVQAQRRVQSGRSWVRGLRGRLQAHLRFWFKYVQQRKVQKG